MTGEQAPEAAAGVSGPCAWLGRRLLSALYDVPALITLFLGGTALLLAANRGMRLDADPPMAVLHRSLVGILWAGYYGTCWVRWGQTFGMKVWGIRLLRADGSPVRWSDALLRLASAPVAWVPLALGVFAATFEPGRRAWHDRWSRTRVVSVR